MKASTAKLYGMLPQTFVFRLDIVNGNAMHADLLTVTGEATKIDVHYPGFAECLDRLIQSGHVIHVADRLEGAPEKGRLHRTFFTCRCERQPRIETTKPEASPKTGGAPKGKKAS